MRRVTMATHRLGRNRRPTVCSFNMSIDPFCSRAAQALLLWMGFISTANANETINKNSDLPVNSSAVALFKNYCAQCHENDNPKAPQRLALSFMAPERIYRA